MSANVSVTEQLQQRIAAQRAKMSARSGNNKILKPPAGKSRWRVLPGWRANDPNQFWHEFGAHWVKDAQKQVVGVYVCERETFNRDCEHCQLNGEVMRAFKAAGITKDSKNESWKQIDEMRPQRVNLVNAIRMDGSNKNPKQPLMLGLGAMAFEAFLAAWEAYNEQGINMLDPMEGRDIVIERTGENYETKYSVTPWATSTQVDPEALTKLFDIDAFIANELESGNRKGFAIAAAAVKGVIAGAGVGGGGRTLIPARAASLIPASTPAAAPAAAAPVIDAASRVIDPDEPPAWTDEHAVEPEPAPAPAPVPNPAVKAAIERARAAAPAPADAPAPAAAAPASMSEEPWKDDELNNLIASLK